MGQEPRDYVHLPLGEPVTAIGGHFLLVKEVCMAMGSRHVLYVVGHAAFETSCCGTGGCAYALVPGYVVEWKARTNAEGLAVSSVEPIRDSNEQAAVRQAIERTETVQQVTFL